MELKTLFEAGSSGNIELLDTIIQQNPLILTDVSLTSKDSPLHVATKAGQLEFGREMLTQNLGQASELSKDGYRPMDIASNMANVKILRKFVKIDSQLEGKDERRALHYAAINGRIEDINELLSVCPESIKDVSASGETALHLAVKNNQVHGFGVLIKWLEMLNMKEIINWPDCNGNTVLHIAASRKQLQTIKLLLTKGENCVGEILNMNARNSKGLTAMDILDSVMGDPDGVHLRQILQRAGALGARDNSHQNSTKQYNGSTKQNHLDEEEHSGNWFKYFKFQRKRDSPSDTRNALLVVAALIATITFQAGVNLPTGILKLITENGSDGPTDNQGDSLRRTKLNTRVTTYLFLFTNSVGLTSSLSIIIYLTAGFPFQRELLMAMYSMVFSYGFSIGSITNKAFVTYMLLGIALILPLSLRWLPIWGNKAWKWWKKTRVNNNTILAI